jgi:hypothetical protein
MLLLYIMLSEIFKLDALQINHLENRAIAITALRRLWHTNILMHIRIRPGSWEILAILLNAKMKCTKNTVLRKFPSPSTIIALLLRILNWMIYTGRVFNLTYLN